MHCVYYPPEVGGLESHVRYLCEGLVQEGHDVAIITSLSRNDLPRNEVMNGVRVARTKLPARTPAGWLAHAVRSVPLARRLAKDADVLHAQAFGSTLPLALARVRRAGLPLALTLHTSHFLRMANRPLLSPWLGRLIRLADHRFAASSEIAEVGERICGAPVETLINGVETTLFKPNPEARPREGPFRIVVPRRLFPKNGVEYFVRALPLIGSGLELQAVVIGDGPDGERLKRLASELSVSDKVRFAGAQPHGRMPSLLASADLAVFPSLMEATSVAALECMACGVPVAATNVGGLPEIVDDSVGGLFRPSDPEACAREIRRLLSEGREGLERRGRAARRRVARNWSNARLVQRHIEAYRELIDG